MYYIFFKQINNKSIKPINHFRTNILIFSFSRAFSITGLGVRPLNPLPRSPPAG